jgi:TolB-like protein/Flp pilus assembly protein TadD
MKIDNGTGGSRERSTGKPETIGEGEREPINFFIELKRRNVYKVAVAYAVVGWLVIQVSSTVLPAFHAPEWVVQTLMVLVAIGLPIALVIAWAFELTPEGLKRTEIADAIQQKSKSRAWIYVVMLGTAISLGLFFLGRYTMSPGSSLTGAGHSSQASIPEKSVAVLPFENLSSDKENTYFVVGIQDEILTRLAKIGALKVISRSSTQQYQTKPGNLRDVGEQLGVANILEGSVQKSNDQVRVNVQLINATNDAHLWAESYDRKLTDLFTVESDIATAIADTLQAKLTGQEKISIAKKPTANPEAYELYVKGRFFWNKRTADDLRRSIEYFHQAIERDPNYALAYAGLAQAWLVSSAYNAGTPDDCFPKAEAAARKALELDDSSSDAHAALGGIRQLYYFDTAGAIAEFERAIELNPNDSNAHHWLGNHSLAYSGQFDRALTELKRAQELDPLSLVINTNLGFGYINAGRLDEGIAQLRKTLELDSSFYDARYTLGEALELKGSISDAVVEYKKAISLSEDPYPLALLGHLYGVSGQKDEAQKILSQILEARERHYVPAFCVAIIHLALGDRGQALHWLEESYRERDGFTIGGIRVDPLLTPLRGDPQFEALAEKIMPARQFAKIGPIAK